MLFCGGDPLKTQGETRVIFSTFYTLSQLRPPGGKPLGQIENMSKW